MRLLLVAVAAALLAVPAFADNPAPPTAQQEAAIDTCRTQGLTPGTNEFNACVNRILNPAFALAQRAVVICRAARKRLPACLAKLLTKANVDQDTQQKVRDAVAACRGNADLRACLKSQLGG